MFIDERYKSRTVEVYGDNETIYNDKSRLSFGELLDYMEEFTKVYCAYEYAPIAIREGEIFKVQYPAMALSVLPGDLFCGRMDVFPLGLGHQYTNSEWGYVYRDDWFQKQYEDPEISEESKCRLRKIGEFWKARNTIRKTEDLRNPEDYKYVHNVVENGMPNEWMPLSVSVDAYRVAGIYLDYEKLMSLGLPGLIEEVKFCRCGCELKDDSFYTGVLESLKAVVNTLLWYAAHTKELADGILEEDRKRELLEMSRICSKLVHEKPDSFREAIQLMVIYTSISGAREWGRMDDFLGEFYTRDLEKGVINEEEAIRLLTSVWRLIIAREFITDDRVVIGGRGRLHEKSADQLALVIMETSRRVKDIVPQLTLRFYKGQNPALYEKALDCIAEGTTYPILYNDDVIIPGVMNVFGVNEKEAEDWLPFGCGEMVINHRRINSPNEGLNLANILLAVMFNGKEPLRGWQLAPDYGNLSDYKTFEDLFDAYARSVDVLLNVGAKSEGTGYRNLAKDMSMNLVSALYDDCLRLGKGVLNGGAAALDGNSEIYGLVTTSDSLYAIKKLVYEEKVISAETMMAAIKANFAGYEKERALMLKVAKFGNDIKEVDDMMAKVHEQVCICGMSISGKYGLSRHAVVNINNKYNTYLGRGTGATPDGRLAHDSLSNANNPTAGMDQNGMTAFIKSLLRARTDLHAGVVQNMKFSKEVFNELRNTVAVPMLDAYFSNGGAQAMITVLGKEDLEAAREHPERYPNLLVRVGGFSARYIELDDDVQIDILNRTLY